MLPIKIIIRNIAVFNASTLDQLGMASSSVSGRAKCSPWSLSQGLVVTLWDTRSESYLHFTQTSRIHSWTSVAVSQFAFCHHFSKLQIRILRWGPSQRCRHASFLKLDLFAVRK